MRLFRAAILICLCAGTAGPGLRAEPGIFAQWNPVWTSAPVRGAGAPLVGNGTLFSTVWLGPNGGLNWEIRRRDVALNLGTCLLQTSGGFDSGDASLDLWNGELRGSVTSERGDVRYLTYAVSDPSVIVIELTHRRQGGMVLAWMPAFHTPVPHVIVTPGEVSAVQQLQAGGHAVAVVQRRIDSRPDHQGYVIAIEPGASSAAALAAASAIAEQAALLGPRELLAAHRSQWHRAYRDNVPMTAAERAFWLQHYQSLSLGLNP